MISYVCSDNSYFKKFKTLFLLVVLVGYGIIKKHEVFIVLMAG